MVNIQEISGEIKNLTSDALAQWGLIAIVILLGSGSFGLGRLSATEEVRPPVSLGQAASAQRPQTMVMGGLIVASRGGSAYYYPWCTGAAKISSSRQVWFDSEQAAEDSGYAPAKGCKGLGGN